MEISKTILMNQANGTAQSKMLLATAQASTFYNVTTSQASAYAGLMQNLTFTNTDLIQYLQTQLVKDYPTGDLVISIKDE